MSSGQAKQACSDQSVVGRSSASVVAEGTAGCTQYGLRSSCANSDDGDHVGCVHLKSMIRA